MGYKKLSLDAGFKMYAPTFVSVGGTPISINSIIPSGEGVGGWGDVSIQIVGADGNNSAEYLWFTAENSGLERDGWLDGDAFATATFKDGDSLLIYSDNAINLQISGEVAYEEIPLQLDPGFTPIGNPRFQTVSIQDLIPSGDGVGGWGDVSIQIVGADGNNTAEYLWFTSENSGLSENCWLDGDAPATKTFDAGDAFLFYTDGGAAVTIPEYEP